MTKDYYVLVKPGIVYGNALTAIAGFLFGSGKHISLGKGVGMVIGLSLIIAGACVFNNILDRAIDAKMQRTQKRALVTGAINPPAALTYSIILTMFGIVVLVISTNYLATATAVFGSFMYVLVYGYAKRKTTLSTIVGSVSGAVPPVVGYVAVTNNLDATAVVLFGILAFWQMPHFYAIALMRRKDYAAASLPVLAVVKSPRRVQLSVTVYTALFALSSTVLAATRPTGHIYVVGMLLVSAWWFAATLQSLLANPAHANMFAKKVFNKSLVVLLVWCLLVSTAPWLANI